MWHRTLIPHLLIAETTSSRVGDDDIRVANSHEQRGADGRGEKARDAADGGVHGIGPGQLGGVNQGGMAALLAAMSAWAMLAWTRLSA